MKHRKIHAGWLSVALALGLLALVWSAFAVAARPLADRQEWQPARELPQAVAGHGAVIHDGYLYVVGGRVTSGLSTAAVCSAKILDNGNLDTCKGQSALPFPLTFHAVVSSTTHLYVLGGWDEAKKTFHEQIWRAEFGDDGALLHWVEFGRFYEDHKLVFHDALLVNNRYLYVIGGQDDRKQLQKKVFYVDLQSPYLNPETKKLNWQLAPDLDVALDKLSAVVKDRVLYVIGGRDSKKSRTEVYYIGIDNNGRITGAKWETAARLPQPREYHKALLFDGKLVVLGGKEYVDGGNLDREWNTMIYASAFAPNGNIQAWEPLPGLIESLQRFAAVTVNKDQAERLYILGGLHGADYRKTVYQLVGPTPLLTLQVTPVTSRDQNDRLRYTIQLKSLYTLTRVTLENTIPVHVRLVGVPTSPATVTLESAVNQPRDVLAWKVADNPNIPIDVTISYEVELITPPNAPGVTIPITNAGVTATWTYLGYPGNGKSDLAVSPLPARPRLSLSGHAETLPDGGEIITYHIVFRNGPYPLTKATIHNTIPAGVVAVDSSYSCDDPCLAISAAGKNPNEMVEWQLRDLQPNEQGFVAYRVQRMTDDPLINPGATLHWAFAGEPDPTMQEPVMSNGTRNPPLHFFLPLSFMQK